MPADRDLRVLRTVARSCAFAALAGATRYGTWRRPLQRDAAQYLYVGDVMLRGGAPYVDAANNKGPLLFVLFAALRRSAALRGAGGSGRVTVRCAAVVSTGMAAGALTAWVSRRSSRPDGLLAGTAFAVLSSTPAVEGDEPNSEHFALAPALAALAASATPGLPAATAAGALTAAAVLTSPALGAIAPLVAAQLVLPGSPKRLGAAALGASAVAGPTIAWLAARGALREAVIQIGKPVARSTGPDVVRRRSAAAASRGEPYMLNVPAPELWVAGLGGAAVAIAEPRTRVAAAAAAASSLLVFTRIKLWGHAFPHHWYPAVPGLAAGAALGGASLARHAGRDGRAALTGAGLAFVWASVLHPHRRLASRPVDPSLALAPPIARVLAERTAPEDRVLVTCSHPSVLVQARRQAPGRFFDVYPIEYDEGYAAERRRGLLADPPAAIARLPWDTPDRDVADLLDRFPYSVAWEHGGARVWVLDRAAA